MSHPIVEEFASFVNSELSRELGQNHCDPSAMQSCYAKTQALDLIRQLDALTENDNEETLYWVSRLYQTNTSDVFRGKASLLKTLFLDLVVELDRDINFPILCVSRLLASSDGPMQTEAVLGASCERRSYGVMRLNDRAQQQQQRQEEKQYQQTSTAKD